MNQTFKIKKGEISFEPGSIKIYDNSRKQNRLRLLSSGIWIIYGSLAVLRYLKTGDQFLLWTGLFIGIANLGIFIVNLLRSNKSEILFKDIKSIEVKERFGNNFLDIRLKNNRLRRVSGVGSFRELEDYIKSNIDNKIHFGF